MNIRSTREKFDLNSGGTVMGSGVGKGAGRPSFPGLEGKFPGALQRLEPAQEERY